MLKVKDEIKIKLTFISSEVDKRKGKRTFTFWQHKVQFYIQ